MKKRRFAPPPKPRHRSTLAAVRKRPAGPKVGSRVAKRPASAQQALGASSDSDDGRNGGGEGSSMATAARAPSSPQGPLPPGQLGAAAVAIADVVPETPRVKVQDLGRPICFSVDPVPDFLDKVIAERLLGEEREALKVWLAAVQGRGGVSIGSVCAGTDCAVDVAQAVLDAVSRSMEVPMVNLSHRFSFELNPLKQSFLSKLHPNMEHMFGDAMDLPSGYSFDQRQQERVRIPHVQKVKAGFPCTDVSLLNPSARKHRSVVGSGSLRTGGVFQAILRYLESCHSTLESVTLENVTALLIPPADSETKQVLGPSNATVCVHGLERIGLITHLFQLDPESMFGLPVSRPRLYFLSVPEEKIKGLLATREYHEMLSDIMSRLVGHPAADMDDFLLPEGSAAIQEYYSMLESQAAMQQGNLDQAMIAQGGYRSTYAHGRVGKTSSSSRSTRAGRPSQHSSPGTTPRWVEEHQSFLDGEGSSFASEVSTELASMYPGLLELTARELDILQLNKVSFPERRKVTVELSQSIARTRVKENNTACVTPTMRRYLAHRCRIAHGIEAMNLQCIRFGGGERMQTAHAFPSALLQDLAGNAFNALCDAACELALTVVLASAHLRRLQALQPPIPEAAGGDSDSDGEGELEDLWAASSESD